MTKSLPAAKGKNKTKESTMLRPSLLDVQRELTIKIGSIGVLLNEMYLPGAGARLFGLSDQDFASGFADDIDVSTTVLGRYLPVFHAYAYDGRVLPGHERTVDPFNGRCAELLIDFVELFGTSTYYMELANDVACGGVDYPDGGLKDLVDHMLARHSFDQGHPMSIQEIALLANMNERSVRNATTTTGKNHLALNASGEVDFHTAAQWLSERSGRGFTPTVKISFPVAGTECDNQLDAIEIPAFIKDRLHTRFDKVIEEEWQKEMESADNYSNVIPQGQRFLEKVAGLAQLEVSDVLASMDYPLAILPRHCSGLARALGIDATWFTLQVMRALYPNEMDMVLNPAHYQHAALASSVADAPLAAVEIELTSSMIGHGYLDLPTRAKTMFPDNCFTEMFSSDRGAAVTLIYGKNRRVETDIRIKSEKTISPRKRFTSWLQTELNARPGDKVRIERKGEREYEISFQAVSMAVEGAAA